MKNYATKQEYVYDEIRKRIIDNIYKPGTMLIERSISDELGISRTPVREALRRLASVGLVNILPQKGVFVTDISISKLIELFELREALEKMAVKLLIQKADDELFKIVETCAKEQLQAYKDGNADLFMRKDMEFHNLIAKGSGNARLADNIADIYDLISMLAISVKNDGSLLKLAWKHHERILRAIRNRNTNEAEMAIMRHIVEIKEYHIVKQLGINIAKT